MLKLGRTIMSFVLAGSSVLSYAQTRPLIDDSRAKAEEVLLVKVVWIDTCLTASLLICRSYVRSDVVEILKRSRFPAHARKFNFMHKSDFDLVHIPKDKMLKIGQQYFVFVSTRYIAPDEEVDEESYYRLIERPLGYIEYNEDLHRYLKSKREGKD